MENEFDETMAKQTDARLIEILSSSPEDYQPLALDAARREFDKRNLTKEQINLVKQGYEEQQQLKVIKADQPLNILWKVLSFIFPGIIPLIIGWTFKADGFDRKAREVVRWTIYGFGFYFVLVILIIIF